MVSISIFGCESGPNAEGTVEVLGPTASPDEAHVPEAKSGGPELCLAMMLPDLSAALPSLWSSDSLADRA